jgi:hypothetical protein
LLGGESFISSDGKEAERMVQQIKKSSSLLNDKPKLVAYKNGSESIELKLSGCLMIATRVKK